MNFILLFVVMFFVLALGGGLGYIIYIKTRPKKQTWEANVYTISDAVKTEVVNDKGKIIKKLELKDLQPYAIDIIEKIEDKNGTLYKLQKLNKPTPPIEAKVIENWGTKKVVNVLYAGGSCTLLNKGYENSIGTAVYDPLPADRINLITQDINIKTKRLTNEKDILQAITPWIVAGVTAIALVGITYIIISGLIEINDRATEALEQFGESITEGKKLAQGKTLNPSVTLGVVNENKKEATIT